MEHAAVRLSVTLLVAALIALMGVLLGLWWAPFPVGLALGVMTGRARVAVPAGAGMGLLAWLVPMAVAQVRFGLGPSATALAAIMGFDRLPAVPVILALVVGTLLGLAGAWLGSAARGVVAPAARVDATRNG
jgi:hypothetical protein